MEVLLIVVFTILGMAIASFLNVCIDRLPRNQSLLFPPSHCPACEHRLAPKDLIPVFSYLRLRGRCRYCRAPIPRRLLGMEIGIGALFPLLYWHYDYQLSAELGIIAYYCCLFIVIFAIDWEHGLILNKITYPAMIAAVLIRVFRPESVDIFQMGNSLVSFPPIAQAAIGGAVGFGIALLVVVLSRGGMGFGDVKLAALMGLVIGFPLIFFSLILAAILGGIVAVILLLRKKKRGKEAIPFGPALAVAAIVTLIWPNIPGWYLGLF
ncbi:MAG: prepilin peptidase [Dehalococcoidales bacterium]|nr:prepilin peptidase [Dehalococcoidales bacterium]